MTTSDLNIGPVAQVTLAALVVIVVAWTVWLITRGS